MNINIERILASKAPSHIKQKYDLLKENHTLIESIAYIDFIRSQPVSSILENSKYIYSEPQSGVDFLLTVLKTNDLSINELLVQKESISEVYNQCVSLNTTDDLHLSKLTECIKYIDMKIDMKYDPQNILRESLYNLHMNFLPKPTLESSFNDDMDLIIQNINTEPSTIDKYQELLDNIRRNKISVSMINIPSILVKNTALIIGITVTLTAGTLALIVSLPLIVAHKLIDDTVNIKYVKSYISTIDKQIHLIETEKQTSDGNKKKLLTEYQESLKTAKTELIKYKSNKPITEGLVNTGDKINALEHDFSVQFISLFEDDTLPSIESLNQLMLTVNRYEMEQTVLITEGSFSRKVALRHEEGVRKLVHGIKRVGSEVGRTPNITKRTLGHIDNLVSGTIDKVKNMDKNERRTRIVEGEFKGKLFKILRNGVTLGLVYAVSPALMVVGLLSAIAIDQKLDHNTRQEILHELENELKMCEEKIEDAKGDQNKEKKYQLMRLKHKLENDIGRIRYHLD